MFYCAECKKLTLPGTGQESVITETRNKLYYNHKNELIGEGYEIVKESKVCSPCHTSITKFVNDLMKE